MQERPNSNPEFAGENIFERFNQYLLLSFALCCMITSVFIQEFFSAMGQFRLGISVAPIIGIILPIFLLSRRFDRGATHQLRIRTIRVLTTVHVALATLAMVVIVDQIYIFSQQFMPQPDAYLEGLRALKPTGAWSTILTFVGVCISVPVSEEIVFRGVIQRVFARNMGTVIALVLASVFFGVVHLNPQLLLSMIAFGVFAGLVFWVTSNLTYAMIAHGVLNGVAFVQLTTGSTDDLGVAPFYLQNLWYFPAAVGTVGFLLWKIKKGATLIASAPVKPSDDSDTR